MKTPEKDIRDRTPVWDLMQNLYMDTDVTLSYDSIIKTCASSTYTMDELEEILFNEVLPALKFNMFAMPAPEWAGFDAEWLVERILKKHRFGKRKPWILRRYTKRHWEKIRPLIEELRRNN